MIACGLLAASCFIKHVLMKPSSNTSSNTIAYPTFIAENGKEYYWMVVGTRTKGNMERYVYKCPTAKGKQNCTLDETSHDPQLTESKSIKGFSVTN